MYNYNHIGKNNVKLKKVPSKSGLWDLPWWGGSVRFGRKWWQFFRCEISVV